MKASNQNRQSIERKKKEGGGGFLAQCGEHNIYLINYCNLFYLKKTIYIRFITRLRREHYIVAIPNNSDRVLVLSLSMVNYND